MKKKIAGLRWKRTEMMQRRSGEMPKQADNGGMDFSTHLIYPRYALDSSTNHSPVQRGESRKLHRERGGDYIYQAPDKRGVMVARHKGTEGNVSREKVRYRTTRNRPLLDAARTDGQQRLMPINPDQQYGIQSPRLATPWIIHLKQSSLTPCSPVRDANHPSLALISDCILGA
ncbi:hypothetical protein BO94DRAFT_263649 [Aspergillus sclerotioniger CBS 115572]|uniref:Uncharacterized protein n=1 Tax=Aspergillus sclerotioniger CBS 115572 TaxID=1450535 RepID=A0A317VCW7_9EURO|nr:hypothetical protein BO94DRAFT_263649 [Aspergillus sclerotioniger CBS 115572]PWY71091.1 hypothetical protein BO94DRAFT_263649 [Aspergillus sclerotioniger CBS 115572]